MNLNHHYDLAVIGAGPAGMAAAIEASRNNMKVLVLDDQPAAGGQVYRQIDRNYHKNEELFFLGEDYWLGKKLVDDFKHSSAEFFSESRVWQITLDKHVFFSRKGRAYQVQANFILISTGATERPMPIPGWTLPGVMSVGGAQTLLKSNNSGADGAVFAGSGPLFYLTIWQYLNAGFKVGAVIDTAPGRLSWSHYLWALPALLQLNLLLKGLRWKSYICRNTKYFSEVRSVSISGQSAAKSVSFIDKYGEKKKLYASHVFLHQGVVPNVNLTMATGLKHYWCPRQLCWHPETNIYGESSLEGIFVAGDGSGIAGASAAILAGKTAAKQIVQYSRRPSIFITWLSKLKRYKHVAARPFLDNLFRPPKEWRVPVEDETIVCRCEALKKEDISSAISLGVTGPNQLKSFCRAGMGRCQGRMCGLTIQQMIADNNNLPEKDIGYFRLRPPIRPLTVGELASLTDDNVLAK